jgi:hypothetical protein
MTTSANALRERGADVTDVDALAQQFESYHAENQKVAAEVKRLGNSVDLLQKDFDGLNNKFAGQIVGASRTDRPDEQSRLLAEFARNGGQQEFSQYLREREVRATMTVGSDPDGG